VPFLNVHKTDSIPTSYELAQLSIRIDKEQNKNCNPKKKNK
jgi:hypothetical protein